MSGVSTGIAMDDGQPLSILQFSPAAGRILLLRTFLRMMPYAQIIRSVILCIMLWCLGDMILPGFALGTAGDGVHRTQPIWHKLITDAKALKLPTKFIEKVPAGFVHFEFDDLRTLAAEYHPEDHRMV